MQNTRETIKKYNIQLTKSLGQNFLTDFNVVKKIVNTADVGQEDVVIEVGPGIGTMTLELAKRAKKVIAIEIDKRLIPALEDNLSGFSNVQIINMDIMKADINAITSEYDSSNIKVVANLPYYITTPIIMKFLEEDTKADMMVFMIQKEVARRIVAGPGTKDYGALSVAVQYYSKPEKAFDVPPHCFIPQPDVDSAVIKLIINKEPPVKLLDKGMFFKTVKCSFAQRRKTLINALYNTGGLNKSKEEIKEILKSMGVDENTRGEMLSIQQFAMLSNLLYESSL
ncbi:16S rRNA (adenine(1518)-N(6)/adenine(1519)-N(6))-dimethyltransferase RsmA [Acetivibrio saccincola]|mgnify:CR=1 FL=1|jgi:16S rRNA (adenine1518-N6/adenine1519-N6)-dimethyltransferase|uniref:Ribosomal RNA small subunit methyltransferase A n=1 Tax=Acetivibrio saccincola TaxID=1677857 RepID=A0A2K9EF85_9FIRM|nr:16S rRNA (adenine(1518)-N(6)/adenine(1519)-N(6))-dimethyltransferase RsmA [Acetivibrio saccincola]AUG58814.1 Ribosomal RNA small subunit methyltransferase A [Acetivibrio saccincola]PQQ66087.1 16S rRNA (adenine(1518)-N(6)/adenine(1519)-N(6))-dimethyltransferase [Acetivibrio saccincola]HOA96300.1 16S rRNA (adenine(1518)-N(6)/adenine(1519)-N(6))-dimethyltransferase RsmA [Acetivibrio saccincola]HQD28961.1 16S rRNA (adenine(1518)-N(6)/adenine(1519)-N(6))-dimethyltransferase RsmA [Acetivibrio sacc